MFLVILCWLFNNGVCFFTSLSIKSITHMPCFNHGRVNRPCAFLSLVVPATVRVSCQITRFIKVSFIPVRVGIISFCWLEDIWIRSLEEFSSIQVPTSMHPSLWLDYSFYGIIFYPSKRWYRIILSDRGLLDPFLRRILFDLSADNHTYMTGLIASNVWDDCNAQKGKFPAITFLIWSLSSQRNFPRNKYIILYYWYGNIN